jgi:hypothetical protein
MTRAEATQKARDARLPRIPKPKPIRPEQVKVKRRRVVDDIARAAPVGLTRAAAVLPRVDTEAFIRANPERYEVLPMDAPWSTAETLSASHRRAIQGVA